MRASLQVLESVEVEGAAAAAAAVAVASAAQIEVESLAQLEYQRGVLNRRGRTGTILLRKSLREYVPSALATFSDAVTNTSGERRHPLILDAELSSVEHGARLYAGKPAYRPTEAMPPVSGNLLRLPQQPLPHAVPEKPASF